MMILMACVGVAGFASITWFCLDLFKQEEKLEQQL